MVQNWQALTGISSVVIALCALFFTIWSGWRSHIHNKLSVRPHLTTWVIQEEEKHYYGIELVNNGLGPALIECFVIKLDGNVMKGRATEPIENIIDTLFNDSKYKYETSLLDAGYSMPANEKRPIATIQFLPPFTITPEELVERLNRCDLHIEYKSIYGDRFSFTSEITN